MPSLDSAVQEQGFRSSLFGFDKDDVLAYLSALTEEAQRQEQAHLEKEQQLQAQIDKLKNDQSNARACVETLQQQLAEAERRAALAEKQYDEEAAKLAASEQRAAELAARNREIQQNANELQFKCRDLQRQLDARPAESAVPAAASAPAVSPGPEPAAAAPAGTEPVTPAAARLEARRILADARISAQNAEQRLNAQAEEQKRLMAENARGIAAGVLVLRDRLARVDARLDAATLDLENATAGIYQALDATEQDLRVLGLQMDRFGAAGQTAPRTAAAQEPGSSAVSAPASAAPQPRSRAAVARKTNRGTVRPAQTQRLRRAGKNTVSQELLDALDRLDQS